MNSKIIIPISALLLLTLATPSFAQTATPTSIRKQINESRKETKNEIKEIKKETKTTLSNLKKDRVQGLYQSIRNSLTKRFDFLQKTKSLIETRINEKSSQNKDVTTVKAKLAEFSKSQTSYSTNLATVDSKLQELLKSNEPKKLIPDLRNAMNKVRTDLNNMHRVLVDTLRLLVKVK